MALANKKGRAGYGATVDGLVKLPFSCPFLPLLKQLQWPYSYDSCDVGTLPNQTYPGTQTPLAAVENGDPQHNNVLVRGYSRVQTLHMSPNSIPAYHAVGAPWSALVGVHLPRRVTSWPSAAGWLLCWPFCPRD